MIRFLSDNASAAHPAVLQAVVEANEGFAAPYGADSWTGRLEEEFSRLFETEVGVFPVQTGTAANALAMACLAGPLDEAFVHADSHLYGNECNAAEFYSGGLRLQPLAGADGKIKAAQLECVRNFQDNVHAAEPKAVSITQATEHGTLYKPDDIRAIGEAAKRHGLHLHMDGARFANAVAALGCTPAELTWKLGINALSFGGTKNGCMVAEAVVLFGEGPRRELARRLKRAGQLLSKRRYVSAQLLAYVKDDLWLECARHANRMCGELAERLRAIGIKPAHEPEINMLFVDPGPRVRETLAPSGYHIYEGMPIRLCTSWCTTENDIECLEKTFADRG